MWPPLMQAEIHRHNDSAPSQCTLWGETLVRMWEALYWLCIHQVYCNLSVFSVWCKSWYVLHCQVVTACLYTCTWIARLWEWDSHTKKWHEDQIQDKTWHDWSALKATAEFKVFNFRSICSNFIVTWWTFVPCFL